MSNESSIEKRSQRRKKRRKKNKKPFWIKLSIGIFSILLICFIGIYALINSTFSKLDNVKIDKEDLGITSTEELKQYNDYKKIKNIALLGIDSEDGIGRSDAIMIATIDPVHDKLKITSIMRDSYVNIPDHGYDKINHAYAYGGPQLSIKTLNQNFGLNIEDFAAVDFSSLPVIIDMLGGLEINVTEDELYCSPNINDHIANINSLEGTDAAYVNYPGTQLLNGVQALAYSRIRATAGGDAERTNRQRTVLDGLFQKAITTPATQYLSLINQFLPYVQTNLDANDILSLATKVATMGSGTLEQERFPRDGYCWGDSINGIYYLMFDEAATKKQMMDYIFDDK